MKKKRDKKYVPKGCVFPLGIRNQHKTETPVLTALSLLGTAHLLQSHVVDLMAHAEIARMLGGPPCYGAILQAGQAIQERHARLGTWGATGDEIQAIKAACAQTIPFIRSQPNIAVARAAHRLITGDYKKE